MIYKSNPRKVKAAIVGNFYLPYDSIYEANRDMAYLTEKLRECGGIKILKGKKGNFSIKVLRQ